MIRFVIASLFCLTIACSDPSTGGGGGGGGGTCTGDAVRCSVDGDVQRCVDSSWRTENCPAGTQCLAGACEPMACSPGALRCDRNGGRERCDDTGSWQAEPCGEGSACIDGGTCADSICEPGAMRCFQPEGGQPIRQRCADDGLSWQDAQCRRGERCVENGRCQRMECQPTARGCADAVTPATCSDDGMDWIEDEPCPPGHSCTGSGRCVSACDDARSRQSYDGCEFFAVDLPQIGEASRRQDQHPYAVVIANPNESSVQVSGFRIGDEVVELVASQEVSGTTVYSEVKDLQGQARRVSGRFENVEVPPLGIGTFILPSNSAGTTVNGDTVTYNSEKAARAYRVRTNMPVTAYQFQPLCCNVSYTNDASILIPVGSQGRSFRGVSAPFNSRPGFLSVVASENAATVQVDLGSRRIAPVPGHTVENGILEARLAPYEVLTIMSADTRGANSDLTGVAIHANEEVGLFGGHVCTNLPDGQSACDHLETSVMAVETWRTTAVGAQTHLRSTSPNEMNYYRIVAAEDGTSVGFESSFSEIALRGDLKGGMPNCSDMIQGGEVVLNAGQWCGFGSRSDFIARANRPIQLVQFISGQETTESGFPPRGPDHAGDPAMTTVPPTDQYRDEYTFLTPDTYFAQYITIVHPPGSILSLDGVGVNQGEMNGELPRIVKDSAPVGRGDAWRVTIVKVSAGPHQIVSLTGDTFGLMVYAYDDYVSYAYPGGMNLEKR